MKESFTTLPFAVKVVLEESTRKMLRIRKVTDVFKVHQDNLRSFWKWRSPFTVTNGQLVNVCNNYLDLLNACIRLHKES